ncbi:MAG: hypothetical protein AAF800_01610 [Planctomycetota bacterium]
METGVWVRVSAGLVLGIGVLGVADSGASGAFGAVPSPGDAVEVREGDVWSPAEFLGREGRRLQIRYDDGTEEWVTADRLRLPGGGAAPEAPAVRRFRAGQPVELKSRNRWEGAEIKRASPPLYLVAPDGWQGESQFHWRWVDAARLRTPGEDHEGPDIWSQFEHRVNNDKIPASLRAARKAYEDHQRKQAQTARDDDGERDPFAPPPFAYELVDADRSDMDTLSLRGSEFRGGGFVAVAADPGGDAGRRRPFATPIDAGEGGFFESPAALAAAGDYALVVIMDKSPGGAKKGYAERFDVRRGRPRGEVDLEDGWLPLAIDATGNRLAGRADGFHAGSKSRLDVWDWSGRTPRHLVSFTPAVTGSEAWRDVEDVAFADAETVVARTADGAVSGWSVGAGEAVGLWEARPPRGRRITAWAVSPGGAQVALLIGDAVLLIETATGRTLSTLPGADGNPRSLTFSPNGRYVVAAAGDRVKRWDLTAAEAGPSIALPPGGRPSVLAFDDGSVLSHGRLIDGGTGKLLWTYGVSVGRPTATATGRYLSVERSGESGAKYQLSGWPLPDPRAERAANSGPAATLLGDGEPVAIDLSRLEADPETKRAIAAALERQLSARGVQVVASSPVRFVGVTTTRSEQRVYEESFGAPWHREQTEVDVDIETTRLALEADGKPAWAWVTTRSPSLFVTRREGQSVRQAVAASAVGGGAESMTSATLPDVVPDPRAAPAGSSQLVPGGYE